MAEKRERINVSLDSETVERLRQLAKESHISVSDWISLRVWDYKPQTGTEEKKQTEAQSSDIMEQLKIRLDTTEKSKA